MSVTSVKGTWTTLFPRRIVIHPCAPILESDALCIPLLNASTFLCQPSVGIRFQTAIISVTKTSAEILSKKNKKTRTRSTDIEPSSTHPAPCMRPPLSILIDITTRILTSEPPDNLRTAGFTVSSLSNMTVTVMTMPFTFRFYQIT